MMWTSRFVSAVVVSGFAVATPAAASPFVVTSVSYDTIRQISQEERVRMIAARDSRDDSLTSTDTVQSSEAQSEAQPAGAQQGVTDGADEASDGADDEPVSDLTLRDYIVQTRMAAQDISCGNQSGITPFVAAVQIRGWKRPRPLTNEDGTLADDRNDSAAVNITGFNGGGVSLTACIPLVNRGVINRGAAPGEAARGAFRLGWSLWGSIANLGDETEAHLTTGPTAYFHPRRATSGKASAVFGLTLGADIIGWTPDYTTSFVGDNRPTGLFQVGTKAEPETFSLVFNVGISLPERKTSNSDDE